MCSCFLYLLYNTIYVVNTIEKCIADVRNWIVWNQLFINNAAARLICRLPKYCHRDITISHVVKDLHWLLMINRVIFKIILLVFKVLHGRAPSYLENPIRVRPEERYHLRNKYQLLVPKTKCKTFGDKAFFKSGPVMWNSGAHKIRQITNIQKFKNEELKILLFGLAYQ